VDTAHRCAGNEKTRARTVTMAEYSIARMKKVLFWLSAVV
jgi:hypothetical protein